MAKKKISPKVQHAAEKYLASLGSSREQLTDKQWEVFVNYVKVQRSFKTCMPIILLLAIICAYFTFFGFQKTNKLITRVVPDEVIYVTKEASESPISLEPDIIKGYLERVRDLSFDTAGLFMITVMMLNVFVLRLIFKKHRLKAIEALVQRKQEPVPPPDNLRSSE